MSGVLSLSSVAVGSDRTLQVSTVSSLGYDEPMLTLKPSTRVDVNVDLDKMVRCAGCATEAQWSLVTSCSHRHSFLFCDQCRASVEAKAPSPARLRCGIDHEPVNHKSPGRWVGL
jgi:hypothetical protein